MLYIYVMSQSTPPIINDWGIYRGGNMYPSRVYALEFRDMIGCAIRGRHVSWGAPFYGFQGFLGIWA